MTTKTGYSHPQILLHWAIALLILFNYLYSEGMGRALDARLEGAPAPALDIAPAVHVWVGVAVLVLVLLRALLRLTTGAPDAGGTGLMQRAAGWGHRLLYALMLAVPAFGGIAWFGGVDAVADLHALLANVLMVVAGGHALIALYHQYVLKDRLLLRMMRPGRS